MRKIFAITERAYIAPIESNSGSPEPIEASMCSSPTLKRQLRTKQSDLDKEFRRAADVLRASERLVTLGRLAGSIAHEINNPLESITNLLFLIEHEPGLPAAAKTYLSAAQEELGRVVQISKQTLNFCREAPAATPSRLNDLLDQVVVLYTHDIARKNLTLIRQFEDDEPITVFPGEIRQVFSNLIVNAIEASSEGGKLVLRIRRSRLWKDPQIVGQRVTIADNGSGMPLEVRRRIGEAFFTTKGQSGTGLGLWLTRTILARYRGSLLLRSNTGKNHGTVFSIFLPTNLRPRAVQGGPESIPSNSRMEMRSSRSGSARGFPRSDAKGA